MSEYRVEIKRLWGGGGSTGAYQTVYSSLSGAAMLSTTLAFANFARRSVVVRPPPTLSLKVAAFTFRATGLFIMGQLAPAVNISAVGHGLGVHDATVGVEAANRGAALCPFDFNAQRGKGEVYGVTRITRRPELVGLGMVGIGGALLATTATQLAYFGVGPVVCFTLLALHSDRAQRKSGDLSETKEAQTSNIPFLALVDGRQSWSKVQEEIMGSNASNAGIAVGVALLAALRPAWMRFVR